MADNILEIRIFWFHSQREWEQPLPRSAAGSAHGERVQKLSNDKLASAWYKLLDNVVEEYLLLL